MALIDRSEVAAPCLPIEEVPVESLGGEVFVRGMDLPQLLAFFAASQRSVLPGETEEAANQRAGAAAVSIALACTVLASDKKPLWNEEQWRAFGAAHMGDAMRLFRIAMRLSGQDGEAERKNS
jgi:hypothetical protein